jgi:hypothetical protein
VLTISGSVEIAVGEIVSLRRRKRPRSAAYTPVVMRIAAIPQHQREERSVLKRRLERAVGTG